MSTLRLAVGAGFLFFALASAALLDGVPPGESRRALLIFATVLLVGAANLLLASECRCPRHPTSGPAPHKESP